MFVLDTFDPAPRSHSREFSTAHLRLEYHTQIQDVRPFPIDSPVLTWTPNLLPLHGLYALDLLAALPSTAGSPVAGTWSLWEICTGESGEGAKAKNQTAQRGTRRQDDETTRDRESRDAMNHIPGCQKSFLRGLTSLSSICTALHASHISAASPQCNPRG